MSTVKDKFYCQETDSTIKLGDFDIDGNYNVFDVTLEISYITASVRAFNMPAVLLDLSAYSAVEGRRGKKKKGIRNILVVIACTG